MPGAHVKKIIILEYNIEFKNDDFQNMNVHFKSNKCKKPIIPNIFKKIDSIFSCHIFIIKCTASIVLHYYLIS